MSVPKSLTYVLVPVLVLVGCQAEYDGLVGNEKAGLNPPKSRFFFPTGLALTPDGRYLFVTNGNSDLKYNGGTISVVDVQESIARILDPDSYPGSCRLAPQDNSVVECEEGPVPDGAGGEIPGLILGDLTVRLGYYAGFLKLEDLSTAPFTPWTEELTDGGVRRYRLFTPVRGDPSVTFVDVVMDSADGDTITCLDCGSGCGGEAPRDCTNRYKVEGPSSGREDSVSTKMPDEPYGIALSPSGGFVVVAHLVDGALSLIDLGGFQGDLRRGGPDLVDVLEGVMAQDSDGRSGGYTVAARTPDDPAGWFYISNRAASQILTVRVLNADQPVAEDRGLKLVLGPSIVLGAPSGPLEGGADVRGLTFSEDGNRLYAVTRTPPSMVIIDTSLDDGQPRNDVLDVVEVCPSPSLLRIRPDQYGRTLAYAVCYGSGEIYVVDTEEARVVDRIDGGGGPHDLAIVPDGPDVPEAVRGFGFLANFGEHTVGVLDLREDSPTYHQLIGRIGWPEDLEQ